MAHRHDDEDDFYDADGILSES